MYAVISTGGKQYKVKEGQTVKVEKLDAEAGSTLELATLLVSSEDGSGLKVGTPTVDGAKVKAKVVGHGRAAKIQVVKYKPKSRYKRVNGHRQPFTSIQIEKIA
ncbi:MAG: 50S ribosomal protein L21 [Patescibacteria group bacterium]|nr:MAG: 50S ribosomal protein L21 [Patescibacteria group bacterium]